MFFRAGNRFWTKLFCIVCFIYCCSFSAHPIYISSTMIDYKEKERRVEISIKLFNDDLERALSQRTSKDIEIDTDRETEGVDVLISSYVQDNFKLHINGKQVKLKVLGSEVLKDDDFYATYVYLEASKVRRPKKVKVENTLLFDVEDSQQNFMTFRVNKSNSKKFVTSRSKRVVNIK